MVEVFKEGGGGRRKKNVRPYTPRFFNFYPREQGKDCLVVEGLALAWEEITCMLWEILVFGAQDKDVRPDMEETCLECLQ